MGVLVQRVGRDLGWEYSENMSSGTNSDIIKIPPIGRGCTVSVTLAIPATGEGKIQFTTSPDSVVDAGTALWQDWPEGSSTLTVSDSLISQVTAIRLVRTSGTVGIEIVI